MKKTKKTGGVRIARNFNQLTAIIHFIENSTFSIFNKTGSSAIILSASLNPDVSSSYRTVRLNYINKEVRKLLFKIFVCDNAEESNAIKNESLIQQNVYESSFRDKHTLLEPICPCVIYSHSQPISIRLKETILSKIIQSPDLVDIQLLFSHNIGFIAMECMENYKTLYSLRESPKYDFYKYCAIHQLSILHKMGYNHNDFHFENVLIDEYYDYYDSVKGRAIIIDFGLATRRLTYSSSNIHQRIVEEIGQIETDIATKIYQLNKLHKSVQYRYIEIIEMYLHTKIENIMPILSYRGGNKTMKKTDEQKHCLPRKKCDWNLPSSKEFDEMMLKFSMENIKSRNPDSTLEQDLKQLKTTLEKDPEYLKRLFHAQFDGQIITENK